MATACTLGGCSTIRLAYNNADWLVAAYASSYLDLTAQQKKQLRTGLRQAFDQHRREDLKSNIVLLRTMGTYAADGLTEPDLMELTTTLMVLYETAVVKAASVLAPTVADLSSAQIAHLDRELDDYNRDYRDKYLAVNLSERLDQRAMRVIAHLENWTSDLSPAQRNLVRAVSRSWPDFAQTWYDHDVAMQQGLLQLLRAGAPVDAVQRYMIGWWLLQSSQSSEVAEEKDRLVQGVVKLVRALDATFTSEQRQRLAKRINALADELEPLVLPPGATLAAATS